MTRKLLLTLHAVDSNNSIHKGNAWMKLHGALTEAAIRETAKQWREDIEKKGFKVHPDMVTVEFVFICEE